MLKLLRALLPFGLLLAATPFLVPHLAELKTLGPLPFALCYALALVGGLPCLMLALGAGALLGPAAGLAAVLLGELLGSSACYAAGRFLGGDSVRTWAAEHPKLQWVEPLLAREGGFVVAVLHLIPVLPFNLISYACGLLRMRFPGFLLGTGVGVLPGSALAVLGADLVKEATEKGHVPPHLAALVAALLLLVVVLLLLARRHLRTRT